MWETINVAIYAMVVIIAILLIGLVLIQPSKSGGGLGSAFGGAGESVFGAQAMSHLSKLTIVLMSVFFVLTLTLAIISGHKLNGKLSEKSLMSENAEPEVKSAVPAESEKTEAEAADMLKKATEGKASSVPVKTAEPVKAPAVPAPAK